MESKHFYGIFLYILENSILVNLWWNFHNRCYRALFATFCAYIPDIGFWCIHATIFIKGDFGILFAAFLPHISENKFLCINSVIFITSGNGALFPLFCMNENHDEYNLLQVLHRLIAKRKESRESGRAYYHKEWENDKTITLWWYP